MSHIVEIKTEIRDEQAVRAACVRLQLAAPEHKTVRLFSATATGVCVQLPGMSTTVKKIEITVSHEGATSIKTSGFTGGSCRDATRDLERALGLSGREFLLPEYFNRTSTGEQIQQGN